MFIWLQWCIHENYYYDIILPSYYFYTWRQENFFSICCQLALLLTYTRFNKLYKCFAWLCLFCNVSDLHVHFKQTRVSGVCNWTAAPGVGGWGVGGGG